MLCCRRGKTCRQ